MPPNEVIKAAHGGTLVVVPVSLLVQWEKVCVCVCGCALVRVCVCVVVLALDGNFHFALACGTLSTTQINAHTRRHTHTYIHTAHRKSNLKQRA